MKYEVGMDFEVYGQISKANRPEAVQLKFITSLVEDSGEKIQAASESNSTKTDLTFSRLNKKGDDELQKRNKELLDSVFSFLVQRGHVAIGVNNRTSESLCFWTILCS